MRRDAHPQSLTFRTFRAPSKGALSQGPLMESLAERYPTTRALLHSFIKVPGIRALHIPGSPWLERVPHGEMPASRDFFNISSRLPSEGAPLRLPTEPLPREGCFIYRAPFIHLSKFPVGEPSSRFPKMGPLWKEMPVSRAFFTYPSGFPAREPSLQVPFIELPQRETLHT
jgi:hypothetical protein